MAPTTGTRSDPGFPLVGRRRLLGLPFGSLPSARRGSGSEVAGSRPYLPGDDVKTIDWRASARLSSARGSDEFVVQQRYAEEAPRVVVVADRRPAMALYPPPLPWLSKPAATRVATELILQSTLAARGAAGYLDFAGGAAYWQPPRGGVSGWLTPGGPLARTAFDAPEDTLVRALEHLRLSARDLPPGSFVFVLSDFLVNPPVRDWLLAVEHGWEIVPVIVRDPVWETSFPAVERLLVPVAEPRSGRVVHVRLSHTQARARARENEVDLERLRLTFAELELDPVLLGSSDGDDVRASFLLWAQMRVAGWGRAW